MVKGVGDWLRRSGARPLAISLHLWRGVVGKMDFDPIVDPLTSFIGRALYLLGHFTGASIVCKDPYFCYLSRP